jgi:hypothetical protein
MNSEFTLDYIAETDLRDDESWEAARYVGKQLVQYMRTDGSPDAGRNYLMDTEDVNEGLIGASEQPDLTGQIVASTFRGEGTWATSRPQTNSYRELQEIPRRSGSYLGLAVWHNATAENLLRVALPLTPMVGHVLRNGYNTSRTTASRDLDTIGRYDEGDIVFNPRRVRAAAYISRYIIGNKLAHSELGMTPEENLAWQEEYMPYQDLALTGGGGKTVRRRHTREPKSGRKTYTLEELQAMSGPRRTRRRDEQR